jgi:hypothetical protein
MQLPTSLPTSYQAGKIIEQIHMPQHFPELGDVLSFCFKMGPGEAALFLIVGIIMLLFGVSFFKLVVMINAAIIGAGIGIFIGGKAGNEDVGAIIGGFSAALISWPLMKHAVAIMGFGLGGIVGAGLWRVFAVHHPELFWVGGVLGGITFGLLSLLLFRGCVMMYTSFQGASLAVLGLLSLVMKYQDLAPRLTQYLSAKSFVLPLAIFIPTMFGLIFQYTPSAAGANSAGKK